MEATIFTGWIYDHLLPHAAQVKVAHPVMLRANRGIEKEERQGRCRQDCGIACGATSFPSVTHIRRQEGYFAHAQ
jgi:hypothetical protein